MQDDLVVESKCRYLHTFNWLVASLTHHQCLAKKDETRHEAAHETLQVQKLLCCQLGYFFALSGIFFLNPLNDQFCQITQTYFTTFSVLFW